MSELLEEEPLLDSEVPDLENTQFQSNIQLTVSTVYDSSLESHLHFVPQIPLITHFPLCHAESRQSAKLFLHSYELGLPHPLITQASGDLSHPWACSSLSDLHQPLTLTLPGDLSHYWVCSHFSDLHQPIRNLRFPWNLIPP